MWVSCSSWYNCSKKGTKASKNEDNFKLNTSRSSLCSRDSNFKLKDYLNLHKKSVENYNELRKLQGSILRLCRQKLSDHFTPEFVASLNDDDIIRSLRAVQNRWTLTTDNSLLKMNSFGNDETPISRREWEENKCESGRKNANHQDTFTTLKKLFKKGNTKKITRHERAQNVFDDKHRGNNSKRFDVNTFHMRTQASNLSSPRDGGSHRTWSSVNVNSSDECGCGESDSKSLLHEQGYHKRFDKFNEKLKKHDSDIKQIKEGLRTCLDILIRIEEQQSSDDKQKMLMDNGGKIYSDKPYVYCNKEVNNMDNKSQNNKKGHCCSRHGKYGWYV